MKIKMDWQSIKKHDKKHKGSLQHSYSVDEEGKGLSSAVISKKEEETIDAWIPRSEYWAFLVSFTSHLSIYLSVISRFYAAFAYQVSQLFVQEGLSLTILVRRTIKRPITIHNSIESLESLH